MDRSEKVAAIEAALSHPVYYDGDIGADLRWCIQQVKGHLPEIDWERMFAMASQVATDNLARAEKAEADCARLLLERDSAREMCDRYVALSVDLVTDHCACQHDGRGELVSECEEHRLVREERDAAVQTKASYEVSTAEAWAKYRELKAAWREPGSVGLCRGGAPHYCPNCDRTFGVEAAK